MASEWQQMVMQFTRGAEFQVPDKPIELNKKDYQFINDMVVSEMQELYEALNCPVPSENVAKSTDAFIDIIYYLLDFANKHGWKLDKLFKLVHIANMQKLKDGVKKDDRGKVLKPEGWVDPEQEMLKVIDTYMKEGSWT